MLLHILTFRAIIYEVFTIVLPLGNTGAGTYGYYTQDESRTADCGSAGNKTGV